MEFSRDAVTGDNNDGQFQVINVELPFMEYFKKVKT